MMREVMAIGGNSGVEKVAKPGATATGVLLLWVCLLAGCSSPQETEADAAQAAETEASGAGGAAQAGDAAAGDADEPAADSADLGAVPSGRYTLDKSHGYVNFSYTHLGFSRPIVRFNVLDATLDLDSEAPENSSVEVTIDPASVDSGVDEFDGHLRGERFFQVEEYPEITFVSTAYESDGPATGKLTGDLTIKGVTKPVTLDVTLNNAAEHPMANVPAVGFSARGFVNRSDWGLDYAVPAVTDEVELIIEAEFWKQEEGEAASS